jgi:hypothetical protein
MLRNGINKSPKLINLLYDSLRTHVRETGKGKGKR